MNTMVTSFVLALMSFTRIPVPYQWFPFHHMDVNRSMMFFPLIGALIGSICWVAWYMLHAILPLEVLVLILLMIPIIVTGAYHEDGFADVCDSYGGYTKEKRLLIMKDSRIGAFAAIGIVLLLLTKFILLKNIQSQQIPVALFCALVLGRLCAMLPFKLYPYSGRDKRTATILNVHTRTLFIAFVSGISILVFVLGVPLAFFLFFITQGLIVLSAFYFNRLYGGLTGDVGGAMEQMGEVLTYFSFMVISHGTLSI